MLHIVFEDVTRCTNEEHDMAVGWWEHNMVFGAQHCRTYTCTLTLSHTTSCQRLSSSSPNEIICKIQIIVTCYLAFKEFKMFVLNIMCKFKVYMLHMTISWLPKKKKTHNKIIVKIKNHCNKFSKEKQTTNLISIPFTPNKITTIL